MAIVEQPRAEKKQNRLLLVEHLRNRYNYFTEEMQINGTPVMITAGLYVEQFLTIPKAVTDKLNELKEKFPDTNRSIVALAFDKNYTIVATLLLPDAFPEGYGDRWDYRRHLAKERLLQDSSPYLLNT